MDNVENPMVIIGNKIDSLKYEFLVEYKDGTILLQNFNTPEEKNFGHVDIPNVLCMSLVDKKGEKVLTIDVVNKCFVYKRCPFFVQFSGGKDFSEAQPIYFRQIRRTFGAQQEIIIRYCLGIQQNIDGKNYKELWFINPDETITISHVK